MKEAIPADVRGVLAALTRSGHTAWCVGGCVRDMLLGRTPDDWDVAASARPDEVLALFGGCAAPTGLQHGTVTVRTPERSLEVTTYRRDGRYADHRHPDRVTFSDTLREDLERRDFTVNAMAMNGEGRICDPFDGRGDLKKRLLRCVGHPAARFEEDALRIMRGLRFSSVLGFSLDPDTAQAMRGRRTLLNAIASERLRDELFKLLCGENACAVLLAYPDVLGVFLPEILPLVGFRQHNRHHCFDVWEHTARSVEAVRPEGMLRMTMLLHDMGKPECFTRDARGSGHFYGHPAVGGRIADAVLRRLRVDNAARETIVTLVEQHDRNIPRTDRGICRALRDLGERRLRLLLEVKRADNLAQAPEFRYIQREIGRGEAILRSLLEADACFSIRQLAVNGSDLTALGLRGSAVGSVLNALLSGVVDGELPNRRPELLTEARQMAERRWENSKSGNRTDPVP